MANGGVGGHKYDKDALNEWIKIAAGTDTSVHYYLIDAANRLSTILGGTDGTAGNKYLLDAYNEISIALGGGGTHLTIIDALNDIVDNSGGGAYSASAVHIDPSTTNLAAPMPGFLDGIASYTGILSLWIKSAFATNQYIEFWNNSSDNYTIFELNYNNPSFGARATMMQSHSPFGSITFNAPEASVSANAWTHFLFSWDTHHAAGLKRTQVAVNGTLASVSVEQEFGDDSIYWTQDVVPYQLATGPFSDEFDVADFFFAVDVDVDLTNAANIAKFISGGKPVDPATAVAAFGTPAVLFSGNASTFGTNQGSGGSFTLTGSLTNASSSPSD